MRSRPVERGPAVAALALALVALGLGHARVGAQVAKEVGAVDEDLGLKLRHPTGAWGDAVVPWGFRADGGWRSPPPRWNYRFFDHPVPSYQFFQRPQTFRWSWDMFPGLDRDQWGPPGCGYSYQRCPGRLRYRGGGRGGGR